MGLFVPIYAWKVVAGSVINCGVLFSVLGGSDGIYPNLWVICCCNLEIWKILEFGNCSVSP